ncbi:MAG TPA: ABC transporter substrate-binding protein [Candidatus Binatia bacterium]|nr:ABC transporter substrate-binding protein [Candidatus Binatia bacterium]
MSLTPINVMYGHLEGNAGAFARDPSGYLSMEAGIFRKHGLEVSWNHVQGTEERYRRLADGRAHISLVVGRASLQHFLSEQTTKILGCVMNTCPYFLLAESSVRELADLKGKILACREGPSRNTPITETLERLAGLQLGRDLTLQKPNTDQEVYEMLITERIDAALLPRPFGFWAEERGYRRIISWPGIVDDPLPITIETTEKLWRERGNEFESFLKAHREGLRYFKANRDAAVKILRERFGHSPAFAAKTFDDYAVCMDETLKVDFRQLEMLVSQVAPDTPGGAREIASLWIAPGALKQ